jgi:hypothetical protein
LTSCSSLCTRFGDSYAPLGLAVLSLALSSLYFGPIAPEGLPLVAPDGSGLGVPGELAVAAGLPERPENFWKGPRQRPDKFEGRLGWDQSPVEVDRKLTVADWPRPGAVVARLWIFRHSDTGWNSNVRRCVACLSTCSLGGFGPSLA